MPVQVNQLVCLIKIPNQSGIVICLLVCGHLKLLNTKPKTGRNIIIPAQTVRVWRGKATGQQQKIHQIRYSQISRKETFQAYHMLPRAFVNWVHQAITYKNQEICYVEFCISLPIYKLSPESRNQSQLTERNYVRDLTKKGNFRRQLFLYTIQRQI